MGLANGRRGFTLVELMIVLSIIAVIAAIALPNLIEARKGANEAAAVGALRAVEVAQSIFREMDKDHNSTLDYASTLGMLAAANLIDPKLATGTKQGYEFYIDDQYPGEGSFMLGYGCWAQPLAPGQSGDRYFAVTEEGLIRFTYNDFLGIQFGDLTPIGQ